MPLFDAPDKPVRGISPNLHRYIVGSTKRVDYILVTLTLFLRSHQHFEISSIGFPLLSLETEQWILDKFYIFFHCDTKKELI